MVYGAQQGTLGGGTRTGVRGRPAGISLYFLLWYWELLHHLALSLVNEAVPMKPL